MVWAPFAWILASMQRGTEEIYMQFCSGSGCPGCLIVVLTFIRKEKFWFCSAQVCGIRKHPGPWCLTVQILVKWTWLDNPLQAAVVAAAPFKFYSHISSFHSTFFEHPISFTIFGFSKTLSIGFDSLRFPGIEMLGVTFVHHYRHCLYISFKWKPEPNRWGRKQKTTFWWIKVRIFDL